MLTTQHLIKFSVLFHQWVLFFQSLPRPFYCVFIQHLNIVYSFHSKDNSQSTLGILSYSILSHSRDNQPTLTLSISSVSLPISLLSCATPCILSHQILSHSMDNQTDITPVLILFISTKSLVYNVPFQAFHHIRFFLTVWTIRQISPCPNPLHLYQVPCL